MAAASRLGRTEGDGDNGAVAEERPGLSDDVVAEASRPEGVVVTDTPRSDHTDDAESIERLHSAMSVPTSGYSKRAKTRGQVQWGALAKRPVQWEALTNRPALRSPPRTEALPPNENSGEQ